MINKLNIRGYINYLYLQRYGSYGNGENVPIELLNNWSKVPEEEIQIQLNKLYESWNWNKEISNANEELFTKIFSEDAAKNLNLKSKHRKLIWLAIVILMISSIIGIYFYTN